jgi:hypothetical protein
MGSAKRLGILIAGLGVIAAAPATPAAEPGIAPADIAGRAAPADNPAAELARRTVALANAQAEIARLDAALAVRDELLVLGRQRNAELFAIASEILEKYRNAGILTGIGRREPFVQSGRVRMERLVQDYEDRLRSARVTEQTLAPSIEKRMASELGTAPGSDAPDPVPAAETPR